MSTDSNLFFNKSTFFKITKEGQLENDKQRILKKFNFNFAPTKVSLEESNSNLYSEQNFYFPLRREKEVYHDVQSFLVPDSHHCVSRCHDLCGSAQCKKDPEHRRLLSRRKETRPMGHCHERRGV